ncbi:ABC transporter B family member 15 [Hordeum vulgare]|nr:ABC transporter B family member 15 [Hordeum vulgare]
MGERLTERVRDQMLAKILSFEVGWFDEDENSSAAVCARLATQATKVRSLVGDRMCLLVQAGATASLGFALALYVSWRLALVMMAMQPMVIASFYFKKVLMTAGSRKAKKAQVQGSQLASEAVVNHRTITAFSSQRRMLQLYEAAQVGPRKDTITQSWFSGFCLCLCQFNATSSTALALWYGGKLMAGGQINTTQLFQVFFILMSMGRVIADAGSLTSDLAQGGDAVRSIIDTLDREPAIKAGTMDGASESDDDKEKMQKEIKGAIEFRDVHFSYPTRPEVTVLAGLSLEIGAGKTVALVGPSGSGKSTVIGLIERFLRRAERLDPDRRQGHPGVQPDAPPVARGAGEPGADALLRHDPRQHHVRRRAGDGGGGSERGPRWPTPTSSSAGWRAGTRRTSGSAGAAVGRAEAADRAGEGGAEEREDPAAGRGDERARHGVGAAGAGRRRQDAAGDEDVRGGGAQAIHGAQLRHDRRRQGREGGGERDAPRPSSPSAARGMYYNLIKLQHGASPCHSPVRAVRN